MAIAARQSAAALQSTGHLLLQSILELSAVVMAAQCWVTVGEFIYELAVGTNPASKRLYQQ